MQARRSLAPVTSRPPDCPTLCCYQTSAIEIICRGLVTFLGRQEWILSELARGVKLTRADVERQFNVGDRTVKRDLKNLVATGQVEFVRLPAPGHYRLAGNRTMNNLVSPQT